MITMKKGPEYVALENEALNALVAEMQSLREEVIIWKQILTDR